MKILKTFSVGIWLFVGVPCFAAPPLTPEQKASLLRAIHQGQYSVRIVEKEIDGLFRSVILIGETHRVNVQRHFLGLSLVETFNFIGIEGPDLSAPETSGFASILESSYDISLTVPTAKARSKPQIDLSSLVGRYAGPLSLAFDRYIGELATLAQRRPDLPLIGLLEWTAIKEKHEITQSLSEEPVKINLLEQSSVATQALQKVPGFVPSEDATLSTLELRDLFTKIRNLIISDKGLDLVQLELNSPLPAELIRYAETLLRAIKEKEIIQDIEDLEERSNQARNQVMSKNIIRALKDRPSAQVFLIIVGLNHVPGLASQLVEAYGFQEFDIKSLE